MDKNKKFLNEQTTAPRFLNYKTGKSPYENPDRIIGRKGIEYLEQEVERDPKFHSEHIKRITALLKNGWEIVPAKTLQNGTTKIKARDQEIRDFVVFALANMESEFETDIMAMFSAISRGYSVSEINYKIIEKGRFKGKIGLKNIRHKQQRYFAFKFDDLGYFKLTQIDPEYNELDLSKFIHFIYGLDDENPYGQSVASICAFWVWLKKNEAKFWAFFSERFGQPLPYVEIPENTKKGDDADRAADMLLYAVHNDTGVKVPKNIVLKFLEATRSGDVGYETFIDRCEREIALAVNGQTLTSEQGGSSKGSHALGSVHANILNTYTLFDLIISAAAINKQLIQKLVDINFADVVAYPSFYWKYIDFSGLITLSQSLQALTQSGLKIPVRWVYDITGIPIPENDEEILSIQKALDTAVKGVDNKVKNSFSEKESFANANAKTKNALKKEEEYTKKNDKALKYADDEIIGVFENIKKNIIKQKSLKNVEKEINKNLPETLSKLLLFGSIWGKETALNSLNSYKSKFKEHFKEANSLDDMLADFLDRKVLSKKEYNKLSRTMKDKSFSISQDTSKIVLEKLKKKLSEFLKNSPSPQEINKEVAKAFDEAGISKVTPAYIETVSRTNLQSAYSISRDKVFDEVDKEEYPYRQSFTANDGTESEGGRVRDSHQAFHLFTRPVDDPIWKRLKTPYDYGCRCGQRLLSKDDSFTISETIPDTSKLGFVE